jgi:hypothetical protein
MKTETIKFKGWTLFLDAAQIIPNDPGAGTPAMVYSPTGVSGTYWCVNDTGEIGCGDETVPRDVARWLESKSDDVDAFIDMNSPVQS